VKGNVDSYMTAAGKRWRIRYDLPPDPITGRRRATTKRGFTRERDAQRALREILVSVERGTYVEPSQAPLGAYLGRWLDGIRVRPTTLAQYRQCADVYVIPRLGGIPLHALTPEHLDGLYRQLERSGRRDGRGLAPKSVRHVHTMLRKALQDATQRGHVLRNVADLANPPTAKQARSTAPKDRVWTGEQLRMFLESVRDDRMHAAWHLLATTGMRRGELLGLRWSDVDLDARRLHVEQALTVVGGKPTWTLVKTDRGSRVVALDQVTVAVLRAHRTTQLEERMVAGPVWHEDEHGPLVFTRQDGGPVHPERLSDWFEQRCGSAGLPHIGVHGLRHSYITVALRAGVSPEVLSPRVGHADVAITLSIYAHVRREDDEAAAATAASAILGWPK
jgi:integrase